MDSEAESINERLEQVVDELSWLQNQDEISGTDEGVLAAAESSVEDVLHRRQYGEHLSGDTHWGGSE